MGLLFFIGMKMRPATQTTRNSESPPVQEHSDYATEGGDTGNLDVFIQDIVNLAGEGKVPDVPFVAGESDSRTVHQQWGTLSK